MRMTLLTLLFLGASSLSALGAAPTPILERELHYPLDVASLEQGNFQYFYGLLRISKKTGGFENLFSDQSQTPVEEILKTFLPLDSKKLWDPDEGNYLAVAKVSHLLPVELAAVDEQKLTAVEYLQKTLPRYSVRRSDEGYHIGGSLITPSFHLTITFLGAEHPLAQELSLVDRQKLLDRKLKVALMHQDRFGRVMFIRTAKASSALILYEDLGDQRTLVTQYILSNLYNAPPARDLIRKGMIDNLQDVVQGSRGAIR